ncbi:MAG TPA: GNAT family N-acetyltransferase [Thermomicrobiales bacterium]|jgi:mycothiol synthase|nr:GNAT family N-acetyltransferase [Thermomicrobiales bacterium]
MSEKVIPVSREFSGETDLARLVAMLHAVATADKDGMTVSPDDYRAEWVGDEPGWVRSLRVWEAGDRFVAAFGNWHQPEDTLDRAYGELDVHPDWREPVFVDEVVAASIDAVSELADRPVEHRLNAFLSQEWKQAALERAGYAAERYFFRMSAPITGAIRNPQIAEGFSIRPMAGDAEVDGWVAAFNGAFAGHYDPPTHTAAEKRNSMTAAGYLPEADLVLIDGDNRIIGVGRNSREILEGGQDKGWINSVAILPEYRGKGLGRALLLSSMAALQEAGFTRAHLHADSENESGALQLYESAGFTVDSRIAVYMRMVIPADNLQQIPAIP